MAVFASEIREHQAGWCTGPSHSPVLPVPYRRPT
jgi:hypothetical protein